MPNIINMIKGRNFIMVNQRLCHSSNKIITGIINIKYFITISVIFLLVMEDEARSTLVTLLSMKL